MCGIWILINYDKNKIQDEVKCFWNIQPRGPDTSCLKILGNVCIGFHKLAIMDKSVDSDQPFSFIMNQDTVFFVANGEIYNFKELDNKYNLNVKNSDCLTIPRLYEHMINKYGPEEGLEKWLNMFEKEIKGEFVFSLIIFDKLNNLKQVITGRDQIGIRPLYYNNPLTNNKILFTSEIKGALNYENNLEEFPPGNIKVFTPDILNNIKVHTHNFEYVYDVTPNLKLPIEKKLENIRTSVIEAVKLRLDANRPMAFLLSGGVDSSLVAGIAAKLIKEPLNTFCCGMKGATDFDYARKVAEHIGSNHTEVYFTEEEGLAAIRKVIYVTETYDTTTIRASVGQYLVSKYISENTDCKVVFVGEGPDEVCSSYLFNYYCPQDHNLHETAKEYVKKIHMYDGRRSDRCISNCGLEGRVALLDPQFIKSYWELTSEERHPKFKNMEKWWLREAFNGMNLIPDEILWRKKEAFSDGVSSKKKSWFKIIEEYVEKFIPVNYKNQRQFEPILKYCCTKENAFYVSEFVRIFGKERLNLIPHYWQPKWNFQGNKNNFNNFVDPSARTLTVYE